MTSSSGDSSGASSGGSSGFTSSDQDAGNVPPPPPPSEIGVVEGNGLFCGRATSGGAGDFGLVVLAGIAVVSVTRRRRR